MSKAQTSEIIAQIIDAGGGLSYNNPVHGTNALVDSKHEPIGYIKDDVVTFINPEFSMENFREREAAMYSLTMARIYVDKSLEALKDAHGWHSGKRGGKLKITPLPPWSLIKGAQALNAYRNELIADLKNLS
jgi:hypothetical protein